MKLRFSTLRPGEKPITSVAEYMEMRYRLNELEEQILQIRLANRQQRDIGEEPDPRSFEKLKSLDLQADQVMYEFARRKPSVLISRCPYCEAPIWTKVGVFSLLDKFWYFEDDCGRD